MEHSLCYEIDNETFLTPKWQGATNFQSAIIGLVHQIGPNGWNSKTGFDPNLNLEIISFDFNSSWVHVFPNLQGYSFAGVEIKPICHAGTATAGFVQASIDKIK